MTLPFTTDQFLNVFVKYNEGIWPAQPIAYAMGLAAVFYVFKKNAHTDQFDSGVLALYWLWIGISYHWLNLSAVTPAAYLFGLLFVVQGLLLSFAGVRNEALSFRFTPNLFSAAGLVFIFYAIAAYPLIGALLGHGYPRGPSFGVAPCPTAIFTFGLLLLTDDRVPKYLLVIPLLWSFIGFFAALSLGIREDIGLLAAGVLGTLLIALKDRALPVRDR